MKNEIIEAVSKMCKALAPTAKTNIGKVAAQYATMHTMQKECERVMAELKPTLVAAAMFDNDKSTVIYNNKVFTVGATQTAGKRTFDRTRALITFAKDLKMTMEQAEKLLEKCYKTGEDGVSVNVKVL